MTAFGRLQQRPELGDEREKSVRAHHDALAARDRFADSLRTLPANYDGTTRLLASILVDGERLMRELDVRDGAHVGGVTSA